MTEIEVTGTVYLGEGADHVIITLYGDDFEVTLADDCEVYEAVLAWQERRRADEETERREHNSAQRDGR